MSEDRNIHIIHGGNLRYDLTAAWRQCQEEMGGLAVMHNGVPEFVIVPVAQEIRMVNEPYKSAMAREVYHVVTGRRGPEEYATALPRVSPEMVRRSLRAERIRMRRMMTPFWWTHYHAIVGVVFPIPSGGGLSMVERLVDLWLKADKA